MSTCVCFASPIFVCLVFCGSAVIAQDHAESRDPAAADQDDARSNVREYASEIPYTVIRPRESFLAWMIRCMGPIGLLIPLAGMCCFVLTLIVVTRSEGPFAFAALVFLVPIPFLLGLLGTLQGMILSLQVIATSTVAPKPSEISDGIATSLFNPALGLLAMAPSYLVATLGSIIRSLAKPADKS